MQALAQNKQKFYYATYLGKVDEVDALGYKTGDKKISYSDPVACYANISAARGTADIEQFGISDDYERTICTSDLTLPISEDSILWVGIEPTESGVAVPHNYKVVRVAKSLNSIVYAIAKVSVK